MNRGFRLAAVLCGLMHGDFIVSGLAIQQEIYKETAIVTAVTAVIAAQNRAEQDCSTGGTPSKPTPSPKKLQDSCDDLLGSSSMLSRGDSVREFFPAVPCVACAIAGSSVSVSPTSTNGQFDSEKSSPALSPALGVSASPSVALLDALDIGPATDCTTGGTPPKPTPSPSKKR